MRIHHNQPFGYTRFYDMAKIAGAELEVHSEHRSRSHIMATEIRISGNSRYLAQHGEFRAATWDQWGIFLGAVFEADPSVKVPGTYVDADTFHWMTRDRFRTLVLADSHRHHKWGRAETAVTKVYSVAECECGAGHRWFLNREHIGKSVNDVFERVI